MASEPSSLPDEITNTFGSENIALLPEDPMLARFDAEGKPTATLPDDSSIVMASEALFNTLLASARQ
jgi:CO dehydrogenase maturation factor